MLWRRFQNNPCGKSIGDCAVRAISVALNLDWYEAFDLLCNTGRRMCNLPSADEVWGAVLISNGFRRSAVAEDITAGEFAKRNPHGVFVLGFGGHVATVVDGEILDSWNSAFESVIFYYRRV